jgi:parallel beta-helix repeat protein
MRLPLRLDIRRRRGNNRGRRRLQPTLSHLEDRTLLSPTVFTVNALTDIGAGSGTTGDLLYCIEQADANTSNPAGSLIEFEPSVFSTPQTITLQSGLILSNTTDPTTISGPSSPVTVSGGGPSSDFSVMTVLPGVTASITDLTIANGNAVAGAAASVPDGGGIANFGNLALSDDTISNNTALNGGGIANIVPTMLPVPVPVAEYPVITLTNVTIAGNTATDGGGIDNAGLATLNDVTIAGNSASSGGGLYDQYETTLNNSIIAHSGSGGDIESDDASESGDNNLIDDATSAGDFTNGVNGNLVGVTPLLANLSNYGGPTETMALLPGSPAIDAGNNWLIPAGVDFDQRGPDFPRVVNGTVDIGAFESSGFNLSIGAGNNQSAPTNTAFPLALQVSVTSNNVAEPVDGGDVNLTAPTSGASATFSPSGPVMISSGTASVIATANGVDGGPYTVSAAASGASPAVFSLTNEAAAIVVTTLADSYTPDQITLPQALEDAAMLGGSQTITFAPGLAGTISLTGPLVVSSNVSIEGPGDASIVVSGGGATSSFSDFVIGSGVTASISGLTIANGNATDGGGIYNDGTLLLCGVTLAGNSAADGGGILNEGSATLTNVTIANNSAADGGGIGNRGTVMLTNVTIAGNTASIGGGGIANAYGGTATLNNTIVASNAGGDIDYANVSGAYDLIDSASSSGGLTNGVGGNIVGVPALLAGLNNYGGPTPTVALLPGSPAIDGGDTALAVDPEDNRWTTDQRGLPRVVGASVDMGAFESSGFTLAVTGGNNQSTAINTAFPAALQVSVMPNNPGDAVDGGVVTFIPPASGASATLSPSGPVTIASGVVSVTATANGIVGGPYSVSVVTTEALPVAFTLTNQPPALIVTTLADSDSPGFTTLRDALTSAAELGGSQTVTFAAGLTGTISLNSGLVIDSDVSIDGPGASSLTVSGGGPMNAFSVFTVDSGVTASISSLTITNGFAPGNGGGVFNDGTLVLNNATISGDVASRGGGVFNRGMVSLYYDTISQNSAAAGAGVDNNGTAMLSNCTLSENSAGYGGGIENDGVVMLVGDAVSGNTAYTGGGLDNGGDGTATLDGGTVGGNLALDTGGGGIFNAGAATLSGVTVSGNLASDASRYNDGGGLLNDGTVTLTNATVSGNVAYSDGGGIYNGYHGNATLYGVTLGGNTAAEGGGLFNDGPVMALTDGTIVQNSATDGGGIDNEGAATLAGDTLEDNSATNGGGISNDGIATLTGGSLVGNSATYGGAIANWGATILTNVTISGNSGSYVGGGIGNFPGGYLSLAGVTITGNSAGAIGGGIENASDSTATLNGVTISNNSAGAIGGGIDDQGAATLTNVTISDNSAVSGTSTGWGGGIDMGSSATATISGSTLADNAATSGGGGVANDGALTLTSDTFFGNSASDGGAIDNDGDGTALLTGDTLAANSAAYGGAIDNAANYLNAGMTLNNVIICGNSATESGGGIYNDGAVVSTFDTFVNDSAAGDGGALDNSGYGTATLIDDTLAKNSATAGGGIENSHEVQLADDTLSGNSASDGGGIDNESGVVSLANTIVANSGSGGNIDNVSGSVFGESDLIDDASTAGGFTNGVNGNIVGVDPLLAPLGNYGGPTQTMPPLPGSPAIGAGSTALVFTGVTTDQRGEPRTVNSTVDIGAVETQGYTLSASGTPQSAVTGTAFANLLSVTVAPKDGIDPVDGGTVTFTPPVSGASATLGPPATATITAGVASVTATANSTAGGPYSVTASAAGATPVSFSLTNTPANTGVIEGNVWDDLDDSGIETAGDPGLAGWTVFLDLNGDGTLDPGDPSTTTDANGNYEFTGLAPGTYTVVEVPQPGWVQTSPFVHSAIVPDGNTVLLDHFDGSTLGTVTGNLTYVPSQSGLGEAASFSPGTFDSYALPAWYTIGSNTDPSTQGTIEMWVDPQAYGGILDLNWYQTGTEPAAGHVVGLGLTSTGALSYGVWNFQDSSLPTSMVSSATVPLDQWSEIAVTWGPNVSKLYIDGVVAASVDANVYPSLTDGSSTVYAYLNYWGNSGFSGLIDEFNISSIQESDQEILEHATAGAPGVDTVTLSAGQTVTGEEFGDYQLPTATTTALVASANPADLGQSVTFTASVSPATATGTVTFVDGSNTLGTGTLDGSGVANFTTSTLSVGSHAITAVYGGDTDDAASTSSPLDLNVNPMALVTSTADSGPGSLREAILDADANDSTPITIAFAIPTTDPGYVNGVFTIQPISQLPVVGENITVDGSTQTAFTGNTNPYGPVIEINGAMQSSGDGLELDDYDTVEGLDINGFQGVAINLSWAFSSDGLTNNDNQILDNYLGTDPTGTIAVPNGTGVAIVGYGSPYWQSTGNLIQGNLISGNLGPGIAIGDTNETQILDNMIGTDRTGTANLGNGGDGILLGSAGAPDNTISNNIIAFNQQDGIEDSPDYRYSVAYTTSGHQGNAFLENSIFSNGMLGIDLIAPGTGGNIWAPQGVPLQNTPGGPHQGANLLQNYPVLSSAISSASNTVITGSLNSTPNETFDIELFASPTANPSGFGEGETYLGDTSVTTDASGNASFSVPVPVGGLAGQVLSATATDPGNNTSEFSQDVVIQSDASTSQLVSSANPSVFQQAVSFTDTVSAAAPGSGTPTGTVQFQIGGVNFGLAVTLVDGVATSMSTSRLAIGNYSVTAIYSGDGNFTSSTSSAVTQNVQPDYSATSVTPNTNPTVYGQSVTFAATVQDVAPGSATPIGTVTFMNGSMVLKTVQLFGGKASYTTKSLSTGSDAITAVYNGDSTIAPSTSPVLTQVVNQDATTTFATSSVNPSVYGQTITFTANVSARAPGSGTPTGNVTFMDGSTPLGTATLGDGKATFRTSALEAGVQSITVDYSGDSNFLASVSTTLSQTVNQDATTTNVKSSLNPSTLGDEVTFTATVTASRPGSGTPTGTVTFMDGTTVLGSGTLNDGVATYSTSSLSVGTHSITAVYSGDDNFKTSTSGVLKQRVKNAAGGAVVASAVATVDLVLGAIGNSDDTPNDPLFTELAAELVSAQTRQRSGVASHRLENS